MISTVNWGDAGTPNAFKQKKGPEGHGHKGPGSNTLGEIQAPAREQAHTFQRRLAVRAAGAAKAAFPRGTWEREYMELVTHSIVYCVPTPTGSNIPAQGNALG
jgi:hypothetical protein